MFAYMCSGLGLLLTAIGALIALMWNDLKTRIETNVTTHDNNCNLNRTACQKILNDRIDGIIAKEQHDVDEIWEAVDTIAPRQGVIKSGG